MLLHALPPIHSTRRRIGRVLVGGAFVLALSAIAWLARSSPAAPEPAKVRRTPRLPPPARPAAAVLARPVHAEEPPSGLDGTVMDVRGRPLAGASLCALHRGAPNAAPVCTSSDASGRFALPGLTDPADTLVASAEGFISKTYPLPPAARAVLRRLPLKVTLEAGGLELAGVVVDALGGAVPGARLAFRSAELAAGLALTTGDAEGHFVVRVGAGDWDVLAHADGYSRASLRVRAPARGLRLPLAPEAVLLGQVVDARTGEPVAAAEVRVAPVAEALALASFARSEASGDFRVEGLEGGRQYHVSAAGERWGGAERWLTLDVGRVSEPIVLEVLPATTLTGRVRRDEGPCSQAAVSALGPVGVAVQAGPEGEVRLEGLLPGRYRLTVLCPRALPHEESLDIGSEPVAREWLVDSGFSASGRVEGPAGRAEPGAVVSITPVGAPPERMPVNCTADARGEFACTGLGRGAYDCEVSDTGEATPERLHIEVQDRSIGGLRLSTGSAGSIRVSVAEQSRAPKAATRALRVFARDEHGVAFEATPEGGAFIFARLPLGRYALSVDVPSSSANAVEVRLVHAGQVADVELPAPEFFSIAGRILDDRGDPWLDAWIQVSPSNVVVPAAPGSQGAALSDAAGEFTLSGLVAGLYDVHVHDAAGEGELRGVAAGASGIVIRKATPPR